MLNLMAVDDGGTQSSQSRESVGARPAGDGGDCPGIRWAQRRMCYKRLGDIPVLVVGDWGTKTHRRECVHPLESTD